ncbi:ABC transporter substrate-binding protein [Nonomuraea sp. NPDC050310]|uniref:ABC transporter substrate-binding protein n=1 Tax=unclassified Nonomuraea TaxID=2593643 RepID=UPI0033F87F0D
MPPKLRKLTAGALAGALLLTGCATNGGAKSGSGGSAASLTLVTPSPPTVLDIAHGFNTPSTLVQFAILDTPVTLGEDGSIKPSLAESFTEPKPGTYVFKLRPGVRFSDGTPVTAEDVAYSLERHLDPELASQAASTVITVKKVEVTAPDQVTVELKSPNPTFLANAALIWQIVPKKLAEANPQTLGTPEVPTLGTGPYKVTAFTVDGVTLERNDQYWGPKATLDRVKVTAIGEPEAMRLAVSSGSVDGTTLIPPQEARKWEGMKGVDVRFYPGNAIAFLSLNVKDKYLRDVHVRRAIAHAVNRTAVQQLAVGGKAAPARTILPQPQLKALYGEQYEQVVAGLPDYPYDLAAAKAELAKSAYPDGFTLTVPYASDDKRVDALQAVAADLGKIGIKVDLKPLPPDAARAQRMRHQDLTMGLSELSYGTPDPGEVLPDLLGEVAAQPQGFNFAQYTTPEMEAKINTMLGLTGKARQDAVTEIITLAAEEQPYIPLYYAQYGVALNEKFVHSIGPWTVNAIGAIKVR